MSLSESSVKTLAPFVAAQARRYFTRRNDIEDCEQEQWAAIVECATDDVPAMKRAAHAAAFGLRRDSQSAAGRRFEVSDDEGTPFIDRITDGMDRDSRADHVGILDASSKNRPDLMVFQLQSEMLAHDRSFFGSEAYHRSLSAAKHA